MEKAYLAKYNSGVAKLFVSEPQSSFFVASLLYRADKCQPNERETIMDYQLKHFPGDMVDEVVEVASAWLQDHVGEVVTLVELPPHGGNLDPPTNR